MSKARQCGGMSILYLAGSPVKLTSTLRPWSSSEGVQVGGVRSLFGVLGSWTTVFHDAADPVGQYRSK